MSGGPRTPSGDEQENDAVKFHPYVATTRDLQLPIGTAVEVGDLVFLSGFIGAAQGGGPQPFHEEARGTIRLIGQVLGDLGLSLDHVIKVSAFLSDLSDFGRWNEVFNEEFSQPRPLRTTFEAGLVTGLVELEVVAARRTRQEAATTPLALSRGVAP
jgi:2-iminobutanoate/2-iminopropanoate deaminase